MQQGRLGCEQVDERFVVERQRVVVEEFPSVDGWNESVVLVEDAEDEDVGTWWEDVPSERVEEEERSE